MIMLFSVLKILEHSKSMGMYILKIYEFTDETIQRFSVYFMKKIIGAQKTQPHMVFFHLLYTMLTFILQYSCHIQVDQIKSVGVAKRQNFHQGEH